MSALYAKRVRLATTKMNVPSEEDGTFTLPVRLDKEQLDGSFLVRGGGGVVCVQVGDVRHML
jgi:hypothetical protein